MERKLQNIPTNEEKLVKRRNENVIRRTSKDEKIFKIYGDIIKDQENRFIEKVNATNNGNYRVHYIPHHPVKKDSLTTPIRIVYNSCCNESDRSPS